jgi:glutaredoxin 3
MTPRSPSTPSLLPLLRRRQGASEEEGRGLHEIDVARDAAPSSRPWSARSGGRRTVPQIFIGATHVGGCDDIYALDARAGSIRC